MVMNRLSRKIKILVTGAKGHLGCAVLARQLTSFKEISQMNKILKILPFLLLSCNLLYGQAKVSLLGIIHEETLKINSDSVFKAILAFKPDVILYEADTILNIRNDLKGLDAIEFHAINKYLKKSPETLIFPFDWTGKQNFRNQNNYWPRIDSVNKTINEYFSNGKANLLSLTVIEGLSDFSMVDKLLSNEDLKTINQPFARKLLELKLKWENKKIIDMANSDESLKTILPALTMGLEYWDKRNIEMAKNILTVINNYPNKRVLILTGNNHKYYLYGQLDPKQKENNFKIMEYWEK
jgi:hypothetical protein